MPAIYVLDVPEFRSLLELASKRPEWTITMLPRNYFRIESNTDLVFHRKDLRMKPAVWYGCFTAGVRGKIVQFDRDTVRVSANS